MRLRDGADIQSLLGTHSPAFKSSPESGPKDSFEEVGAPLLDSLFERAQFWNIKETSESLDAECRKRRGKEHPFLAFFPMFCDRGQSSKIYDLFYLLHLPNC